MKILVFNDIAFLHALNYIVHHDSFKDIPKILEDLMLVKIRTKKPPYKLEIEMLKQQQFDPELRGYGTIK